MRKPVEPCPARSLLMATSKMLFSLKEYPAYRTLVAKVQAIAATKAEAGMVSNHAHTILPATPQRTADIFCEAPTPTMAPVMVWVVETGTPKWLGISKGSAPPLSAQKPPTGLSLVIFWPMVLTMRQPPNSVPAEIAV